MKRKFLKKLNFKIYIFIFLLFIFTIFLFLKVFDKYHDYEKNLNSNTFNQITSLNVNDNFPNNYKFNFCNNPESMQFNTLLPRQSQKVFTLLKNDHFIGTILIIKRGKIVFKKSYGYADFNCRRLNEPNDVYQLASIQKSITGVLIMKEINHKKLSLNESISNFYPTIPYGNKITIRELLDMTSGIECNTLPHQILSNKGYIEYYLHHLKVQNIGIWNYQPVNYNLLAGILEKLNGLSYQDIVYKQIIKKLKLNEMGFVFNWNKLQNYTQGYGLPNSDNPYKKPIYEPYYAKACQIGTGNMYSNAMDLYLLQKDIIKGKIISRKSLNKLRENYNENNYVKYAGGLYRYKTHYMSHGKIAGFESTIVISKNGENCVVMLSNHNTNHYTPIFATEILNLIK